MTLFAQPVINEEDYIYYDGNRFASRESFEMYLKGTGQTLVRYTDNKNFVVCTNRKGKREPEDIKHSRRHDSMHEAGHKYSDFG